MIPDYAKGKDSAERILNLNNRQSSIDPQDTNGIILVSSYRREPQVQSRFRTEFDWSIIDLGQMRNFDHSNFCITKILSSEV